MKKIEWSDEFSVGVEELDQQHRHLVTLINKLIDNQGASISSEITPRVLGGLLNYVQQHFSLEEELMAKHDFPGLEDHRKHHMAFTEALISIVDNPEDTPAEELLIYLDEWLRSHILHDDQDFREFFIEKGVACITTQP